MIKKRIRQLRNYYRSAYAEYAYPHAWSAIRSGKKLIAYYGYVGDRNFGDELVYEAAEHAVGPEAMLVPITRLMPIGWLLVVYGQPGRFHGAFIGGGTIMGMPGPKRRMARVARACAKTCVFGTGATSGITDGASWTTILEQHVFGGVRGQRTVDRVSAELGLGIGVAGDAALALWEAPTTSRARVGKPRRILVNAGTHHDFPGKSRSREAILATIAALTDRGIAVAFLPMHRIDREIAEEWLAGGAEIDILGIPTSYRQALHVYREYDFAIGERLHFVVLACMANTPFASINYREKHLDFLETIGLTDWSVAPGDTTGAMLTQRATSSRDVDWTDVNERMQTLRDRLVGAAEALVAS